ncbi:ImmA/IrrE family metallo-endopeptidase [Nocardia sp. JCM 34519.1]|uniref:ImmA/IrrE family metallo-endopeptidase n=1 Tax=unclassified Nocardia TaxID=2637762 RepID=UPI001CE47C4C
MSEPLGYDACEHAVDLGIHVRTVPSVEPIVVWVPDIRSVIVQAELPPAEHNEAVAHGVAHAILERSWMVRRARMGRLPRIRVELAVHDLVVRRLIPVENLQEAVARFDSIELCAARLGVSVSILTHRLLNLKLSERRLIPPSRLDRLSWAGTETLPSGITCVWVEAPPASPFPWPAFRR